MTLILLAFVFLAYEVWRTVHDFFYSLPITTYVLQPQDALPFPHLFVCPSLLVTRAFHASQPRRAAAALRFLRLLGLADANTSRSTPDSSTSVDYSPICDET